MFKIGQITLEKGTWNFEPNDRDFIGMSIPSQPSFVLMQYTGLHDKNGKEIYEGDIVKTFNDEICIVEYNHNEFGLKVIDKSKPYGWVDFVEYKIEVIGNKFDNPDLLGGE